MFTFQIVVRCVQYYSPDELNRRYEKTSSIGSKRVVSRTARNNVIHFIFFNSFVHIGGIIVLEICVRIDSDFHPKKTRKNRNFFIVHFTL